MRVLPLWRTRAVDGLGMAFSLLCMYLRNGTEVEEAWKSVDVSSS
jgi:hypothetical protein